MSRITLAFGFALFACGAEMTLQAQCDLEPSGQHLDQLPDLAWAQEATNRFAQNKNIPSVATALIKDGKILGYTKYGMFNRSSSEQVRDTTNFQIASLSKIFTAVVANRLILC